MKARALRPHRSCGAAVRRQGEGRHGRGRCAPVGVDARARLAPRIARHEPSISPARAPRPTRSSARSPRPVWRWSRMARSAPAPRSRRSPATLGMPSLKEVRFRDLKMPFRVERGRFITDPVTLEGKTGKWQLVGGVGLDGRLDYAVSVTLPPDVVAKLDGGAAFASRAPRGCSGQRARGLQGERPGQGAACPARQPGDARPPGGQALPGAGRAAHQARGGRQAPRCSRSSRPPTDSARRALVQNQKAIADSLKRRAKDLFMGFLRRWCQGHDAAPSASGRPSGHHGRGISAGTRARYSRYASPK